MFKAEDHTFAVCAYKESPYLEDCIASLRDQDTASNIIVCTSTPNDYIRGICKKHSLELYVSDGPSGIAHDWNFAMSCAKTPLVTIAHQDDVYKAGYLTSALEHLNSAQKPLIYFCGYSELRDEGEVLDNTLLKVKRLMLKPLAAGRRAASKSTRRRILAFGDPVCCPSVTYVVGNLPMPLFEEGYHGSLDWQMLEKVSNLEGSFLYDAEPLMSHRIHEGSETSSLIQSNLRSQEDYDMFCKFWPKPVAAAISKLYSLGEKSNGRQ